MKDDFDQTYSRYGTYSTQWDYVKDRFGEENLLPFSISDMDFKIPAGTRETLKAAVENGFFGYTRWNHQDFKGAIQHWFKSRFQLDIQSEWCVYSPSVIYSLSVFLQILTQPSDGIVTLTPCYDAFYHTIRENNRELVPCPLVYEKGRPYQIDFKHLEVLFQNQKTTAFLLCNPHNPTGRAFTSTELQQIIDLCNRYQIAIITDEIHMDVRRAGVRHLPILNFRQTINVPLVLLSSPSKTFNSPGLGGSYGIVPDEGLRNQFLNILKGRDGLSSIPYPALLGLMDCYLHQGEWVEKLNEYVDETFRLVNARLNQHPHLTFIIPEATYLGWIDISGLPMDMDELQKRLVQEAKVAIMKGETYGPEGKHFLRLNLGAPRSKVLDGVERLLSVI